MQPARQGTTFPSIETALDGIPEPDLRTSTSEPKHALRRTTRAARRGLEPQERHDHSVTAAERLLALPELREADTVLLYVATAEECDPSHAWSALVADGVRVAFPRFEQEQLVLATARDATELRPGRFGILEPTGFVVPPTDVDVAVLPGVAFDRRGARLGMGGGHYDRLLTTLRPDCFRVGLAFACQITVRVPTEEHDEGVDAVVTETAVHRILPAPPSTA